MREDVQALHDLELAFNRWSRAQGRADPDVGIIVISVYSDGVDFQYLGRDPEMEVDWPRFFRECLARFDAGNVDQIAGTEVRFPSQR